jgi:2-iminobutanoate/2-iminopropanoate deaminase
VPRAGSAGFPDHCSRTDHRKDFAMPKRTSIYVEGFGHKNPIPPAARIGNLMFTGSIQGTDPATGKLPATLAEQCAMMFGNVRRIIEGAGGTTDNIVKMTVWMVDRGQRGVLNEEWVRMFPDPATRPARHTMQSALDMGKLVECDFVAVFD